MKEEGIATLNQELQALTTTTEAFVVNLPSLTSSGDVNVHALRGQLLAHTLVRMAFIHLNNKFAINDIAANVRCVEAAIAIIKLFDDVDLVRLEMLPPTMAVSAAVLRTESLAELLPERLADGWANLS